MNHFVQGNYALFVLLIIKMSVLFTPTKSNIYKDVISEYCLLDFEDSIVQGSVQGHRPWLVGVLRLECLVAPVPNTLIVMPCGP